MIKIIYVRDISDSSGFLYSGINEYYVERSYFNSKETTRIELEKEFT